MKTFHPQSTARQLLRKFLLSALSLLLLTPSYAQGESLRSLNPSDIHFHTFNYEKEGHRLRREKKFDEAIEQYGKANELFNTIKINYPTWNPHIVERGFERIQGLVKETLEEKQKASPTQSTPLYPSSGGTTRSDRAKERAEEVLGNDENLKSISEKLDAIKKRISEKEQELNEQERAGATREDLIAALKRRDAELDKLKAEANKEEESSISRQSLLTDEVLALRKQLDSLKQGQVEEASLKQRNLAREIALKDKEIQSLKEGAAEIREENEKHQASLHEQIKGLNEKITSLNSTIPEAGKLSSTLAEKEEQLKKLQTELSQVKEERSSLQAEKVTTEKEAESVKARLAAREKEKQALAETLSVKEKHYEEKLSLLAGKIENLEKAQAEKPKVVEKIVEKEVEKIVEKTVTAPVSEELKAEVEKAQAEAQDSQEKIKEATAKAEEAKQAAETLIQEKQLTEVQALADLTKKESELEGEREKKAEAETLAEKAQAEAVTLKSEFSEELKKLKKEHEATLAEKEKTLAELAVKEKKKSTQVSSLEKKLKQVEETAQNASQKENSLLKNIELLSQTLQRTQKEQADTLIAFQTTKGDNTKLQQEIATLKQEREILLTRPLRSTVEALQTDLRVSVTEKETLSKNLSENEGKYYEAIDRIEKLQQELETTRNATSKLEADIKEERDIANDVIKTQRERLAAQSEELTSLKRTLAAEEARATNLSKLVEQTKEQYGEVQNKYEGLLAEHEQLKSLLREDKSEDQLKREHAALKREYTVAMSKLKSAKGNTEINEEDLQIAKKQFVVAKAELIKTKHQLELANLRGDKLAKKLQETEAELKLAEGANDSQYTAEEVTMLKDLLKKHQDMQESRKIARSLILEEVKRMGGDDAQILAALDLAETQELILSDDQKQLLANPEADSEFRFSDRATPEERERAEAALNQRLTVHDNLGRNAYEKGHFLAAEEFFQINLEDHPGHIPSMLNLGVARLRKAEQAGTVEDYHLAITSFEDALAMRGEDGLPYALQMLGYSHYRMGRDQEAAEYFIQCLDVDPTNAKAHIFLGSLMAEQNDLKASETHLKKALTIDPTLTEPEYNLALLLASQGKAKEALKHYRQALAKGATSDPGLETTLREALPEANFN